MNLGRNSTIRILKFIGQKGDYVEHCIKLSLVNLWKFYGEPF